MPAWLASIGVIIGILGAVMMAIGPADQPIHPFRVIRRRALAA
jgi:hypothetical protein